MDITSLIVEAVSGAVGGNVAGAALKNKSLGAIGNSIAGIVGGGVGGTILQAVWEAPRLAAEAWTFKVSLPTSAEAALEAPSSWPSSVLLRARWPNRKRRLVEDLKEIGPA